MVIGQWSLIMKRFSYCVVLVCVLAFLSSEFVSTQGFNSRLELPRNGSDRYGPEPKWVLSIDDYGARGDAIHDDSQAFIRAWDRACLSPVRTTIVIPSESSYLVYPVYLGGPCVSKITLKISGTIIAPEDPEAWLGLSKRKWLYFHDVKNLTVEGGGTINGMGHKWWSRSCKTKSKNPCRHAPTAVIFHKCNDLKVRHLKLLNSQQMHMAFTNCVRVSVSHLTHIAPASSPNTDAVHISSSRGVEVKDCIFSTGDDCVSIVGNSSQIRLRRIKCGPGHGISIGSLGKSNTWSHVHDVKVDEAFLSHTDNGLRIKTWQGGSGFASKITFQNVVMENVSNPIIIDQYYCDSPVPCQNQTSAVKVDDISFVHIKGTSATEEAIRFACSENFPCEGLYLEDVELVSCAEGTTRSVCWQAYGLSSGFVYPPACSFPVEVTSKDNCKQFKRRICGGDCLCIRLRM